MALQFPHVEVLGIDLVPPVLLTVDTIPHNCRFEVDDANLSMTHHKDYFDVVQVRCVDQGINDYNGFLYEIAQTIRPGGMLIVCHGDGVSLFFRLIYLTSWAESYIRCLSTKAIFH